MNNAGFELGLADWNTFNGEATITSDAFAGNNALALSTNRSGIDQGFRVVAGETYTLSGYGKTTETAWSGIGLRFYDDNWTLLEKTATRITSSDWAEYTLDAIAPTGATNGILWAWKAGDTGITVVDELMVNGSTPPPPPPTEGELLTNGGFESILSAWNSFRGSETTTTDAFAGSSALQLSENGSGISQSLDIIGGETYQLIGYGKYDGNFRSGLGIDFWDASWTKIEGYSTQINSADWQLYEITQEAPANAAHATIWSWKGGNSGSTILDELSFQAIAEPPVNQLPTITSNGGAASVTLNIAENSTNITNIDATDADGDTEGNGLTYTLEGPDISQISINPNTGEISFNTAPDYETPTDSDGDNQYEVDVTVTNSQGQQDTQALTIAVTDLSGVNTTLPIQTRRIPAETGIFSGSASDSNIHAGFEGTGFAAFLTTPGSGVALKANVAETRTYGLSIRYAAGNNGPASDRSISLVINGTDVRQLSFTRTGNWATWSDLATTIDLQAGNNTIEFRVDGDDTGYINVDYLDLQVGENSAEFGPSTRIQGETGALTGSAANSTIHPGFDGTGFTAFLTTPGSGVELQTNVADAGTYDLKIGYAAGNNGPASDRSISLVINGTDVRQLSFPRTGDWAVWSNLTTSVDLQTGNNTIEFRVDGDDTGYINVDYIDLATPGNLDSVIPDGSIGPQPPIASNYQLNLTTFATHSEFQSGGGSNPTGTASAFGAIDVSAPRDGSGRVFVSSQTGKILGYDQNGNSLGTLLDLATLSSTTGFVNGEGAAAFRGLMYFDFHPDFNTVGTAGYRKVYAGYQVLSSFDNGGENADYRIQDYNNRAGDNQYAIGEWTISTANPNTVEPGSFREVFRVQMEGNNPHGLGEIAFNPNANPGDADYGLLYAAIGDANANGNGAPAAGYLQKLDNPFGKKIRINPLQNGNDSYAIPDSNPFVGQAGVAEEIYALGFRDAQTFSFGKDNAGEDVVITFDIGASQREEISLVRSGGNYGWERFEGTRLNNSSEPLAPGTVHSPPVLEYDHTTGGFAIIGGLRVTDPNDPNFVDKVLFSDLPTGKIFYADYQELLQAETSGTQARFFEINNFTKDGVTVIENAGGGGTNPGVTFEDVVSRSRGDARFGTDEAGNVYIVTKQVGNIFHTGLVRV